MSSDISMIEKIGGGSARCMVAELFWNIVSNLFHKYNLFCLFYIQYSSYLNQLNLSLYTLLIIFNFYFFHFFILYISNVWLLEPYNFKNKKVTKYFIMSKNKNYSILLIIIKIKTIIKYMKMNKFLNFL